MKLNSEFANVDAKLFIVPTVYTVCIVLFPEIER
jgi:hypothetical protein